MAKTSPSAGVPPPPSGMHSALSTMQPPGFLWAMPPDSPTRMTVSPFLQTAVRQRGAEMLGFWGLLGNHLRLGQTPSSSSALQTAALDRGRGRARSPLPPVV